MGEAIRGLKDPSLAGVSEIDENIVHFHIQPRKRGNLIAFIMIIVSP